MELQAQSRWRSIEFLSDLHLCPQDPASFASWRSYMETTGADALFILGDLFEVWVGDDVLAGPPSFEKQCAEILRQTAERLDLFVMCGNRDFLMGDALMQAANAQALADPCVLRFGAQRLLLSHGDALCLDDVDYQQFRQWIRSDAWRQDFLKKPLVERQSIARSMREASETRKRAETSQGQAYADLDATATLALMDAQQADVMIHGHTHQGATHSMAQRKTRWVLSDWCAEAVPPRAEIIRCSLLPDQTLRLERVAVPTA